MYKVKFYYDENNYSEVLEWLKNLSIKSKKSKAARINKNKILMYIQALRQYGTRIGKPMCKHIENKLWELRPLSNRILFFYYDNNEYILLSYFIKKTIKTPRREIEKAKKLINDYIERNS